MADPEAGWRVLRGLLARRGLMRIGLYSERGRADVVALQELIPIGINQNSCAHLRRPMDVMFHG